MPLYPKGVVVGITIPVKGNEGLGSGHDGRVEVQWGMKIPCREARTGTGESGQVSRESGRVPYM